ncbi:SDR family oxidoreductase [Hyphomicrobium sp.]|uniref:SDR family oxidoreductase n=1 Tax=Hyphomicrobium sp. TaxID=82 RepID=UPI003F704993
MNSLFCFGLGYSAEALARRLTPVGWRIAGTARTAEGVERIKSLGYHGVFFDGTEPTPALAAALSGVTHVLVSAGPDADGDPVLRHHSREIAKAHDVRWIGYLSTVGVYGDFGGAWVDEDTPPRPGSERTVRRLAAETAWRDFGATHDRAVRIFRLAGIYGPGRSAIDDLFAGTARRIVKPGQVFNRIHVEDIAAVLETAAANKGAHAVYNVADNEPAPPQDVVAYAASLIGKDPPPETPFETAALSPMGFSFYSENRRVRNARLRDDLGVHLAYPSYREGLAAILAGRTP